MVSLTRIFAVVFGVLLSVCVFADTQWIDVRSQLENKVDSIEGDRRISYDKIVPEVEQLFADKNTPIKLYCRSGGRAKKAKLSLKAAGYTQVENVGGINDARNVRKIEPE
ncbi:MAG: phage shock protein E [Lentisphaeria bacterium]|jgi:phage shock protein E